MMKFSSWDQEYDYETSLQALEAISTIIAPSNARRDYPGFPWGDPCRMLDYRFDYANLEPSGAEMLRQVHGLYRKFEPLVIPGALSKEEVAYGKFVESESKCFTTNLTFEARSRGKLFFRPGVEEILYRAQLKILDILGEVPQLSQLKLRLGPGGTTNVLKKNASVAYKFSQPLACGEPLVPYLSEVLHELPAFCDFEGETGLVPVEVHHGKLTFVPKDAKQYRSVVTEPILSGMCQLGIGDYMRDLLLRVGLDIRDQSLNQEMAKRGSLTGDLATLDLSSASDLVSKELVAFLLPAEWYCFLRRYRSSTVQYKEREFRLEKFSSMGNGFTFALETLIFYALAWASCPRGSTVRAYGDDIIVPSKHADLVIEVLETCGFSVNYEKSFWEGPFRESCGVDYLSGYNIRPYYFDRLVTCEDIFSFHNFLYRKGREEEADAVRNLFLEENLQIFGPDGIGDGHLIGSWRGTPHKRDLGWSGYVFETHSWTSRVEMRDLPGTKLLPAYSIYMRGSENPNFNLMPCSINRRIVRKVSYLRMLCQKFDKAISVGLSVVKRQPRASLPGTRGFRRIRIYTLETPDYVL